MKNKQKNISNRDTHFFLILQMFKHKADVLTYYYFADNIKIMFNVNVGE